MLGSLKFYILINSFLAKKLLLQRISLIMQMPHSASKDNMP